MSDRPRLDRARALAALEQRLRNAHSLGDRSLSVFFLLAQQLVMEAALRYTGETGDAVGTFSLLAWPNISRDEAGAGIALLDSSVPTRAIVCLWCGQSWMYAPAVIACPFEELADEPVPTDMGTFFRKIVPSDPVDTLEMALTIMYAADDRTPVAGIH